MRLWKKMSNFWKGFIVGGITIPLGIVVIEVVVKFALYGEVVWK